MDIVFSTEIWNTFVATFLMPLRIKQKKIDSWFSICRFFQTFRLSSLSNTFQS